MADADPRTSARFDRIRPTSATRSPRRDGQGKEALYSTAPSASPTAQVQLRCSRCGQQGELRLVEVTRLLRPPVVYNPRGGRLWARCPMCGRRAWLEVRAGQALRVLLQRTPRD